MVKNSGVILAVLLLAAWNIVAQVHRSSIRGTVNDPNGALVAGASVRLTSRETNEARAAMSGDEGEFAISSLPPGDYVLEVSASGFNTQSRSITLQINQEFRVEVFLTVGDALLRVVELITKRRKPGQSNKA